MCDIAFIDGDILIGFPLNIISVLMSASSSAWSSDNSKNVFGGRSSFSASLSDCFLITLSDMVIT